MAEVFKHHGNFWKNAYIPIYQTRFFFLMDLIFDSYVTFVKRRVSGPFARRYQKRRCQYMMAIFYVCKALLIRYKGSLVLIYNTVRPHYTLSEKRSIDREETNTKYFAPKSFWLLLCFSASLYFWVFNWGVKTRTHSSAFDFLAFVYQVMHFLIALNLFLHYEQSVCTLLLNLNNCVFTNCQT